MMEKTHIKNPKATATIEIIEGMHAIVIRGQVSIRKMMVEGYIRADDYMWTPFCTGQVDRFLACMNTYEIGATNETFAQIVNLYNKINGVN